MALSNEDSHEGASLAHQVTTRVKRVMGVVERAARGAMGRPEAGTDALFRTLHADHEEVAQLFEKLLARDPGDRVLQLWHQLSVGLTTHARAEEEVVYGRLQQLPDFREDLAHARGEHDEAEKLLAEADAMGIGTEEFYVTVAELEAAIRHHVDEEEGSLLRKAQKELTDEQRDDLVAKFLRRKEELTPEIEAELGPAHQRSLAEGQAARRRDEPATPARKPKAGGIAEKTVKELQEMARARGIEGRSKMTKDELVEAVTRAR